ncbi:hypothetical protein BM221_002336 [Beauveria bassiana]|uniref:Cell wall protein n=1 Tax=Beauveria bassiana TaxID=176275 RepID=A0A2N6NY83_BEABA|nr:hypothetical protein BM221_002336 [Beauveria bassiana]
MHFSAPLVLLTAITGAHALVVPRDTKPYAKVFRNVKAKVFDLDNAFSLWTKDLAPIVQAANRLMVTIEQSTSTVQGYANLTMNETLSLYSPVAELKVQFEYLDEHLDKRKKAYRKAGLCHLISSQIASILDKGKGLAGATISKIPPGAQSFAKTKHAQDLFDTLERTRAAFSADKCKQATTANVTTGKNVWLER